MIPNYGMWYRFKNLDVEQVERDCAIENTAVGFLLELEADEVHDKMFDQQYRINREHQEKGEMSPQEKAQLDYDKKLKRFEDKLAEIKAAHGLRL